MRRSLHLAHAGLLFLCLAGGPLAGCDGPSAPLDASTEAIDALSDAPIALDASLDAPRIDAPVSDAPLAIDAPLTNPCDLPLPPTPERVLFVGNSFTFTASMPAVFEDLVSAAGFDPPVVAVRAIGGQTLEGHRADTGPEGAPARVREGWDVVILQELSTRPTDAIGPAEQFKEDATYFYDLAVAANPEVRVILYETFARRAGHALYPRTFTDPEDMQAQLRFHYDDAAERYIPLFSTAAFAPTVEVARVGDAWEAQLALGEPPRLHGDDDYHPNAAGAYLTAAVFFGTIYQRSAVGLPAIGVDETTAAALQASADLVTGARLPAPSIACPRTLPIGDALDLDFGPIAAPGWTLHEAISGRTGPLMSRSGERTDAVLVTRGFVGTQTGGSSINTLGLPGDVSRDSLWVGSFDGHAAALALEGRVVISGLGEGAYDLDLFASRDGDDGGRGRLTRYVIEGDARDLDVADNRDRSVHFEALRPIDGTITVSVGASPAGSARFGYVGSVTVTRVR